MRVIEDDDSFFSKIMNVTTVSLFMVPLLFVFASFHAYRNFSMPKPRDQHDE